MPSAIQQDVQDTEAEAAATEAAAPAAAEAAAPQKTARELAMEELEARHQQVMAQDNGWELDQIKAAEDDPVEAAQPADQVAATLEAPGETPAAPPATVRVKVDGVETEVPFDEVVRQYQKNNAADKRLSEATRLLREAQEAEAARLLREQQAHLAAQQHQHAADPPDTATDPEIEGRGKEFLKALFEGDEENALTALEKLVGGRQQQAQPAAPTLDIDQITSAVAQHVQQKLVIESALAQNRADYPQLYADPDIESLALAKIERMRSESGMDFFAALDTVSREFADKFGWTNSAPQDQGRQADPAPTTSNRTAKLEQKKSIDNVTSINTKTGSIEPQPENTSDVIAAMRAARAPG